MFLIALLVMEGWQASVDKVKTIKKKYTGCCAVLTKRGCNYDSSCCPVLLLILSKSPKHVAFIQWHARWGYYLCDRGDNHPLNHDHFI
jgi:hypothetical protein